MLKVKVRNMEGRNGNSVPNQFVIETDEGDYFQSYKSIIAFIPSFECNDQVAVYLDRNKWDYSVTTGRYRNQFLGETKKETQDRIDGGEYALVDLN